MGTRNTLIDLNDHLFAELERLGDEELSPEELKAECERAKAINGVAKNIVDNAALVLKAEEFREKTYAADVPRLLIGDSPEKSAETARAKAEIKSLTLGRSEA